MNIHEIINLARMILHPIANGALERLGSNLISRNNDRGERESIEHFKISEQLMKEYIKIIKKQHDSLGVKSALKVPQMQEQVLK